MATQKQIDANRRNAAKSTGPKTARGKSISALNSLRTGDYAKTEAAISAAELKQLTAAYMAEYNPAFPEERFFVNVLIYSIWQVRRCWRLEAAIWNSHIIPGAPEAENSLGALYARAWKQLDCVGRLEESANKRFHSALKSLDRLKARRAREAKAAAARKPSQSASSGLFPVPKRG